jgi:hypothetical protein
MTQWAAGNLTPQELADVIASARTPGPGRPRPGAADPQRPLQFPYTTGFGFINQVNGTGGWQAVDGLYANMPQSTEQILHPRSTSRTRRRSR